MSVKSFENKDKVVHNYIDRALEADPEPSDEDKAMSHDHTFPMKLHYMLENEESDVVSWQPHGRCFMVRDLKKFVAELLPLWFRQSKFASFQRQLNLYGFLRITQGKDKGSYYHEYFLRGRPKLCTKIMRTKVKGKGARKASSPESEPQFYQLKWLPDPARKQGNDQAIKAHDDTTGIQQQEGWGSPGITAAAATAFAPATNGAPSSMNLGEALGFFSNLNQQYQLQRAQENMLLPSSAIVQQNDSSNAIMLNALLRSAQASASTPGLVPIAPAPSKTALDNYTSVLAALKASQTAGHPNQAWLTNSGPSFL